MGNAPWPEALGKHRIPRKWIQSGRINWTSSGLLVSQGNVRLTSNLVLFHLESLNTHMCYVTHLTDFMHPSCYFEFL